MATDRPATAASDNEGLPPGFVPIWTFIKTPEGVVEYEHEGATMLRVQTKTAADVVRGDVIVSGGEQYVVTGVTTYALAYRGTRQAIGTSNPDNHDGNYAFTVETGGRPQSPEAVARGA